MYLVFFIFLLLVLFAYLLFEKPADVSFYLNTDTDTAVLSLNWISLVRASLQYKNNNIVLTIHLLKFQLYSKAIHRKAGKGRKSTDAYRALSLQHASAYVRYGFSDPFLTGIACGFTDIFQYYLKTVDLVQVPDFMPDRAYFIIEAKGQFYLGKTIVRYIRLKAKKNKTKRSKQYGSIQYVGQR